MRRLPFLGFALAAVACGGPDTTPAPQPPPPPPPITAPEPPPPAATADTPPPLPAPSLSDKIQATVKAIFATQNAYDAKAYAALYADDAVLATAGMPEWKGRASIQTEQQKIFDDVPGCKWGAARVFLKDDVAV